MALITPNPYTCTPSSLIGSVPCLECLSEKELLAAILGVFLIATGDTAANVLDNSACFTCLSDKQKLQGVLTILGNEILGGDFDPADLIEVMKCLRCANPQQLKAGILYELCTHFPPIIR